MASQLVAFTDMQPRRGRFFLSTCIFHLHYKSICQRLQRQLLTALQLSINVADSQLSHVNKCLHTLTSRSESDGKQTLKSTKFFEFSFHCYDSVGKCIILLGCTARASVHLFILSHTVTMIFHERLKQYHKTGREYSLAPTAGCQGQIL